LDSAGNKGAIIENDNFRSSVLDYALRRFILKKLASKNLEFHENNYNKLFHEYWSTNKKRSVEEIIDKYHL